MKVRISPLATPAARESRQHVTTPRPISMHVRVAGQLPLRADGVGEKGRKGKRSKTVLTQADNATDQGCPWDARRLFSRNRHCSFRVNPPGPNPRECCHRAVGGNGRNSRPRCSYMRNEDEAANPEDARPDH